MADNTLLDEYVKLSQRYIDSGGLQDDIHYKLRLAKDLAKVREAVLSRASNWHEIVKWSYSMKNIPVRNIRLIDYRNALALASWIDNHQDDALDALHALWAEDDAPINDRIILDRIRDFVPRVKPAPKYKSGFTGGGVMMKVTSAFLMALAPWKYPPYKPTEFKKAYNRTGYPMQPKYADEVYEHALGFLDKLVERVAALSLPGPSNRLEAQSIVWPYRCEKERFDPK